MSLAVTKIGLLAVLAKIRRRKRLLAVYYYQYFSWQLVRKDILYKRYEGKAVLCFFVTFVRRAIGKCVSEWYLFVEFV